jgi:hypothetical protein
MMMYAMAAAAHERIGLLDHAFSEEMQGSLLAGGELHHKSSPESPRFQSLPSPPATLLLSHLRADDALVHI